MCKASIPDRLLDAARVAPHDPDAVLQLGVSYATLQCAELLARGAPGIHFYTLNRSPATRAILSALRLPAPVGRARRGQDGGMISSPWATIGRPSTS